MNNTELANFKTKLAIKLDTSTNEEAEMVASMVDNAAGGEDPVVKAILLHTNNMVTYTVFAKVDNEVAPLGGAEAAIFIENNLINLDLLENVYLFGTLLNSGKRNVVDNYTVTITDNITSDEVPAGAYYIEGDTAILSLTTNQIPIYFIPSTDVIKGGPGTE